MYLSTDLVNDIILRAAIPASQTTWQPANLYALANDVIMSKMVPLILKNIQDYYVMHEDQNLIREQASYPIPTRAIAGALRLVEVVMSGPSPANESRTALDRLNREDLYSSYSGNYRFTIQKTGFYLDNLSVIIYPAPQMSTNILRLSFACRPNALVDPTACGQITAINTAMNQVTIATTPGFSTSSVLDIISAQPGFDWQVQNISPTAVSSTVAGTANVVLTFAALPAILNVGDWVCNAGQSCVVQVPAELQPLLAQYVAVRVLSAQGDAQALQEAKDEQKELEDSALLLISPRTTGNPKRATNSRGINRWV